jgi:PKHD-type hydroxylase
MTQANKQMLSPSEYFEENSYVLLDNVFSTEFCEELTNRMFELYEEGLLVKDDQCPLSDAIYGDEIFDSLLEKLAEPVGQHVGKRLLPTYTYARIYRTGEVLKRHTDRPACEISGTMTLGFEGRKVWPIFFSNDPNDEDGARIDLKVGDLLMYRGEDLIHWRPEFKGKWQCQVFFHYVDADGEHVDQAFDGRKQLGLSASERKAVQEAEQQKPVSDTKPVIPVDINKKKETKERRGPLPVFGGVMIPSWDLDIPGLLVYGKENEPDLAFTEEECEAIIDLASEDYASTGSVGTGNKGKVNKEIRNVDLYQVDLNNSTKWLFDRLSRLVSIANAEHFDYEIMGITHELQLLHYKSGKDAGHYEWHMDIGPGQSSTRKISLSVQLSDPMTYKGGELVVNSNGQNILAPKERGAINLFPSYCMHRVSPMEEGERWALVIWVHGSKRFR